MKRITLKIKVNEGRLISGAMRRLFYSGGTYSPLDDKFAGLGYESDFREAIKQGIFKPSFRSLVPARELNWYRLTPLGIQIVKQLKRKGFYPTGIEDFKNYVPTTITIYMR